MLISTSNSASPLDIRSFTAKLIQTQDDGTKKTHGPFLILEGLGGSYSIEGFGTEGKTLAGAIEVEIGQTFWERWNPFRDRHYIIGFADADKQSKQQYQVLVVEGGKPKALWFLEPPEKRDLQVSSIDELRSAVLKAISDKKFHPMVIRWDLADAKTIEKFRKESRAEIKRKKEEKRQQELAEQRRKEKEAAEARARAEAEERRRQEQLAQRANRLGSELKGRIPTAFSQLLDQLGQGKAVEFNEESFLFLTGFASHLNENCATDLRITDRKKIVEFVYSGTQMAALGRRYANPDFAKTLNGTMIFVQGGKAAAAFGCKEPFTNAAFKLVLRAIKLNEGKNGNGESKFVSTCTSKHGNTSCVCLASLGRGVLPNIHQWNYSRDIIKRIIQGNPVLALQIAFQCGIGDY